MWKFPAAAAVAALSAAAPLQAMAAPPPPSCKDTPAYHAQDFALGKWDVWAGDTLIARVYIEPVLNGCALHEVWTPVNDAPGKGQGLFVFSRAEGQWHYLWAADTGTASTFKGRPAGAGKMQYTTSVPAGEGAVRLRRWSLEALPGGRLRERSTGSLDGGATWQSEYDLMWARSGT
ncbi:hypothetical protein [Novosphingobium beihaiensis]|uniref:DUF1579 domain-containing protein n=1 Tax=Novosphingobium beihaiensis TaxID=2930389 RepID=A0ABT0BL87_9SPHN|nr:hypothetical protein [Novosphingobium beihaiensis]MCJ2185826.1 hypothetical protein [Novosphingobium beihaiensis]